MESDLRKKPKLRRERNFVVEENVDAIQWPRECSACAGAVEQTDAIRLKKDYKTFGKINVEVAGIPYCRSCFAKSRATKRLDAVVWVFAFALGIPLGIFFTVLAARGRSTTFICLTFVFGLAILISYGLVYFIVRVPVKALFRGRFVEPVDAWLIEEKKSSGSEGISVVIEIPNKAYADKFAQQNL